jgi:Anti-sigma factor NepR
MADKLRDNAEAERGATSLRPSETPGTTPSLPAIKAQDKRAQQRAISQGLRHFFDNVVSEPIPDEFVELLKKIDEEKTGRSG